MTASTARRDARWSSTRLQNTTLPAQRARGAELGLGWGWGDRARLYNPRTTSGSSKPPTSTVALTHPPLSSEPECSTGRFTQERSTCRNSTSARDDEFAECATKTLEARHAPQSQRLGPPGASRKYARLGAGEATCDNWRGDKPAVDEPNTLLAGIYTCPAGRVRSSTCRKCRRSN